MTRDRRKSINRIFERVAVGLVILDAILYFVVLQPLRNIAQEKWERSNEVRLRIKDEQARVQRLVWYKDAVPETEGNLDDFWSNDVQSKRKSFSRSTRLLRGLADDAGLELGPTGISYRLDSSRDEPLARMNILVTVKGPFKNLLDFAHGLETTSDDFYVIRDFSIDTEEENNLSLKLSADLYLTP